MNGKESADIGTTIEPLTRLVYRLPEAGQILGGISRNTVRALIKAGELATVPIGAYEMVTRESIAAYIERGKKRSHDEASALNA